MKKATFNKLVARLLRAQTFKEIKNKIFTPKQLSKLIELVACSYMYNEDMKTGTPQDQRLLKDIYYILTGNEDPNNER